VTPATRYLLATFAAALRGEHPGDVGLPPCPDAVEVRELRAAVDIILEATRTELADFGQQATSDPQLRRAIDAGISKRLARIAREANQIIARIG
jgi:hypothetical protein